MPKEDKPRDQTPEERKAAFEAFYRDHAIRQLQEDLDRWNAGTQLPEPLATDG